MRIGMTYDLRDDYIAEAFTLEEVGEFDRPKTIDGIEQALKNNGYEVERIGNIKALVAALAAGKRWDMVFNIAEGVKGIAREAQVPALLEAYAIPYVFSPPEVMITTMDKSLAKTLVAQRGINTAPFAVVRDPADICSVALPFPLFVKPIAEGSSKGVYGNSRVIDKLQLNERCNFLLNKFNQPVLVETYLPGREFTVGILGSGSEAKVLGVMEITLGEGAEDWAYSLKNKNELENTITFTMATDNVAHEAGEVALRSWQVLNCLDGGRVDIRCDAAGKPCFIEVNPLAGLTEGYSDLPRMASKVGLAYDKLIGNIVASCRQRYPSLNTGAAIQTGTDKQNSLN